jgi:hypothetical protein
MHWLLTHLCTIAGAFVILRRRTVSDQELLSLSEAAKKYNIPIPTLRVAVQKGAIEGRKIGSQWVVLPQSVEDYITHRPRRGRPPKED